MTIANSRPYIARKKILERDGYICAYCFERVATEVDHIIPYSYARINNDSNLISACQDCNRIAGNKVFDSIEEKRAYIQNELKKKKWQAKRQNLNEQLPVVSPPRQPKRVKRKKESVPRLLPKKRQEKKAVDPKDVETIKACLSKLDIYPDSMTVKKLEDVSVWLSSLAKKSPPWTWRYIHQVVRGNITASKKLLAATKIVMGIFEEFPHAHVVEVTVAPGYHVEPYTLILADSRPCANPDCPVHFVPRVPWQRYHSAECRKKKWAIRNNVWNPARKIVVHQGQNSD